MKTIFIDIDGTVLRHNGDLSNQIKTDCPPLDGSVEKFNEWNKKGYYIILTTGRKECMRELTKHQLTQAGLFYDQLVMGLPRGERILINDAKPDMEQTAKAYTLKRNEGISKVTI